MYVPPSSHDNDANDSRKLFMEAIMAKLFKGVESTNVGVKEMSNQLSTMSQLVDSHSTFIKQLAHQIIQFESFNPRKRVPFPATWCRTREIMEVF